MTVPLSFSQALEQIAAIQAAEAARAQIRWPSLALLHAGPADRAVLFFHGFTSSPEQFRPLGELFFARGWNVFIPRQPRHGLERRDGALLAGYTQKSALAFARRSFDLARPLGRRLAVVGLSGGASLSGWLGQTEVQIELAAVVAPFMGAAFVPARLTRPAEWLLRSLPDQRVWWDGRTQNANPFSPVFAYTGFSSRAMGEMLHTGLALIQLAETSAPQAQRLLLVVNANDPAVNLPQIERLGRAWESAAPQKLRRYTFPKELGLAHDFVSQGVPSDRSAETYPLLIEQIEAALP